MNGTNWVRNTEEVYRYGKTAVAIRDTGSTTKPTARVVLYITMAIPMKGIGWRIRHMEMASMSPPMVLNIKDSGNKINSMVMARSIGRTDLITKDITRMERRISAASWYGEMEIDMQVNFLTTL